MIKKTLEFKNERFFNLDDELLFDLDNDSNDLIDITCKICYCINLKKNYKKCFNCKFLLCVECFKLIKKCPVCQKTGSYIKSKKWWKNFIQKNIKLYCNICNKLDCKINFDYDLMINNCESKIILNEFNSFEIYWYLSKNKEIKKYKGHKEIKFEYNDLKYYKYNSLDKSYIKEKLFLNNNYLKMIKKENQNEIFKIKIKEMLKIKMENNNLFDLEELIMNIIQSQTERLFQKIYCTNILYYEFNVKDDIYESHLLIKKLKDNNFYYNLYFKQFENKINYEFIKSKLDFKGFDTISDKLLTKPFEIIKQENYIRLLENLIYCSIIVKDNMIIIKDKDNNIINILKLEEKYFYIIFDKIKINESIDINDYYNCKINGMINFNYINKKLNLKNNYIKCKINDNIFKGYLKNPKELIKGKLINKNYIYKGDFHKDKFFGKGKLKLLYKEENKIKYFYIKGNWNNSTLDINKTYKIYTEKKEFLIKKINFTKLIKYDIINEKMKDNCYFNNEFTKNNEKLIKIFI